MTNENAIEILLVMRNMAQQSVSTDTSNAEALNMAIKALEQQTDGDLISRQAVLDVFGDIHPLDYNARAYVAQIKELPSEKVDGDLIAEIDKLPRIKVGNSNSPTVKYCIDEVLIYDLLERYKGEAVGEMTNEEAIKRLNKIKAIYNGMDNKSDVKALDMAIKALEQTDGDLISRQAVENAIAETIVNGESLGYSVAYDILSDLPSVIPQSSAEKTAECDNNHDCEHCDWTECPLEMKKETEGESK